MKSLNEIRAKKKEEIKRKMKMPNKPISVDAAEFDDFVKKYPFVVVDCWSTRCPPCLMLAPVIDVLAKKHAGKVVFGKVSFDNPENQIIAARFGIRGIPTMLIFRDGKLVDRIVGLVYRDVLEEKLGLK